MKAIVHERYGSPDGLRLRELPRPVPGEGEVLVRVRAASVHPDVWHVVTGRPYVLRLMGAGLRRPRRAVPGTDLAGRVEAVGSGAGRFQPGDEVFGESVAGLQWRNGGSFAEHAAAPEAALAPKPARLSFAEAATVPTSGLIALAAVRDQAGVRPGQRVLVNGAGGGVGVLAVQLAKAYGAEVTAVDASAKLALLRSLGADAVIDHTAEDFTRRSERYDAVIDIPGNHPFAAVRRVLEPDGTYVLIGHDAYGTAGRRWLGSLPRFAGLMVRMPFVAQLPKLDFSTPDKREAMAELAALLEDGRLVPVVDRTFPLAEVAEAIRYLASGRAVGKVALEL